MTALTHVSLTVTSDMDGSRYFMRQDASCRKDNIAINADFEWAVKLNRYSLNLIGLWPTPGRDNFVCNLRTLFTFLMITFVIVIPAIHSIIRVRSHFLIVIDNMQFTLPIISTVLKLVIFWWKKQDIKLLIDMIARDWTKMKTYQERVTMISRAQTARIILMCGYGILAMALFAAVVLPTFGYSMRYVTNITDPGRILPLQAYYIFDTTKSPQYELAFISQTIAMICCIMPYTGIDNFLSLLIFHIAGQLDILRGRLANLNNANYIYILKSCISEHARVLGAIVIIEDIFNMILFILFVYFGILFVVHGVYVLNLLEGGFHLSGSQVAYIITIVGNTFGHMCVYCAVGELLTAQCDRIHDAAYYNEWYNLESKDVRNLILIMAKTNKPLYLTAGKVFPLTMTTFCSLLKTSAGYISFLVTARNY